MRGSRQSSGISSSSSSSSSVTFLLAMDHL